MNTTKSSSDEKKELHKKKMREYQFKKYHENKELAQEKSLIKYYKSLGLIDLNDKEKFGDCIHLIAKIRKQLKEFNNKDASLLKSFLQEYIENI